MENWEIKSFFDIGYYHAVPIGDTTQIQSVSIICAIVQIYIARHFSLLSYVKKRAQNRLSGYHDRRSFGHIFLE